MIQVVGCCDVGGSTLRVALADRDGNLVVKQSFPHARPDPRATVETIAHALAKLSRRAGAELLALGAAVPGPLDPIRGVVHFSPNLGWRDVAFAETLHAQTGLTITLDDDANCAALGEQWRGAGKGAHDFLYVVVGTGIGAGLILNGELYRGARGLAGELGHTTIDPDGPWCSCGNRGCLEALAAGPAIAAQGRGILAQESGARLKASVWTARDIIAAARGGDELTRQVVAAAGQALGIGLANAINLLNPELVVIGGGTALDAGELLLAPARAEIARRAFAPAAAAARIELANLGDDAGLIGAARLAWQTHL